MTCVGIEGDIGHQAEFGKAALELTNHPRHQPVGICRLDTVWRLQGRVNDREQRHGRDAQPHAVLGNG
jgi:hypothetical protein